MQQKWGIKRIVEYLGFRKTSYAGRHNCDATMQKVMLALDDELTPDEERNFLDELNRCSSCLEKFQIEKSFKDYLCTKVKRHSVSVKAAEEIRIHIRNVIEDKG